MALIVTVLFSDFIFRPNTMLGNQMSDQVNAMGLKQPLKSTLTHDFQVAEWNPGILGGMPTMDATSGDIMYPLAMFLPFVAPIHKSFGHAMVFHIFLAGVFFYFMLRRGFGFSKFLSFVGGLFYMLNPMFFSHVMPGHDGKMYVIAWLPFIIWHLKLLMETPNFGRVILVSMGIGMTILSSHVQMAYFVMWGLGAYWLFYTVRQVAFIKEPKQAAIASVAFWTAIFLGCGFGAIQLFPAFSYVQDAWSVRGTDKDISFVASWSLHWAEAISLWIPDFANALKDYWGDNSFKLNTEYAGTMAMLGAILAVVVKPSGWRIFWVGTAVVAFLFSMGTHTPVLQFAYNFVPGVNKFRAISMIMFWWAFASVFLSLLFLKDLEKEFWKSLSPKALKIWEKGIIAVAVVLSLVLLVSLNSGTFASFLLDNSEQFASKMGLYESNFSKNFVPALWGWWAMTITILALLYFAIKGKVTGKVIIYTMLVFGLIDILRVDAKFIAITPAGSIIRTPQAIRDLQQEMKNHPFRVHFVEDAALLQNPAGLYNLEGVEGYHDNELKWYRAFRGDNPTAQHEVRPGWYGRGANYDIFHTVIDSAGQRMLNLASFQAGDPYLNISNCEYTLAMNDGIMEAIKNQNVLPRIAFTQSYQVVDTTTKFDTLSNGQGGMAVVKTGGAERMNAILCTPTYDNRKTVLLETNPSFPSNEASAINPVIPVRWKTYKTNLRIAEIDVPANGLLRIAEVWYPGWKVLLDGKKVEPLRADIAWMALEITAGKHTLEMRPESHYAATALKMSVPVWILTVLYGIYALIAMIRRPKKVAA